MSVRPVARALLLCERAIIEEGTRNISPISCFTKRLAEEFPTPPHKFDAFALLSGGQGTIHLEVRITRLDTLSTTWSRRIQHVFIHPLQEVRFVLHVTACVFPVVGRYQAELLADDELVALTSFDVGK